MRNFVSILVISLFYVLAPVTGKAIAQDLGDRVDGVEVISALDVNQLSSGRHVFYFEAGWRSTGQKILVPVLVHKGNESGKRLMLTAAVHGDELNGIEVIHRVFRELEEADIQGTVIGVPGVNQTGLEANNRHFIGRSAGGHMQDPNRLFPGSLSGGSAASLYVGKVWDKLLRPNADIAIDLHTQSKGAAYPLFVFADFSNPVAYQMAFALMPDMIKNDGGHQGTLETAYVSSGVPAVTYELGAPDSLQEDMINRAVAGIWNVMRLNKMASGDPVRPEQRPFVGSSYTNVYAVEGGFAHIKVSLKEAVEKGDHVATIVDPLGRLVRRYHAPHAGRVLAVSTNPLREAGAMLVRILR